MFTLDGLGVLVKNLQRKLFAWAVLICGLDADGNPTPVLVTSGGTIPVAPQSVTSNFQAIAASGTFDIPVGAKGWTATILTGTGTVGGIAVPAGFSDSDGNTTVATITVTADSGSTAYVRYGS